MKYLNKKQLAFILDIKVEDARAMMCKAWEKDNRLPARAEWNEKNKIVDNYPVAMDILMLSKALNLPTLLQSADDIEKNYLTRAASKKWILCDFPEKEIRLQKEKGKKPTIQIPSALRSLLPQATIDQIKAIWIERYSYPDPETKLPTVTIKI